MKEGESSEEGFDAEMLWDKMILCTILGDYSFSLEHKLWRKGIKDAHWKADSFNQLLSFKFYLLVKL